MKREERFEVSRRKLSVLPSMFMKVHSRTKRKIVYNNLTLVAGTYYIVPHLRITTRLFAVIRTSGTILHTRLGCVIDVPLPSTHAVFQSPMKMSLAAFLECRRQIPSYVGSFPSFRHVVAEELGSR